MVFLFLISIHLSYHFGGGNCRRASHSNHTHWMFEVDGYNSKMIGPANRCKLDLPIDAILDISGNICIPIFHIP